MRSRTAAPSVASRAGRGISGAAWGLRARSLAVRRCQLFGADIPVAPECRDVRYVDAPGVPHRPSIRSEPLTVIQKRNHSVGTELEVYSTCFGRIYFAGYFVVIG